MCIAQQPPKTGQDAGEGRPRPIRSAVDVPLGDGLADAAKTAILSRREVIRRSVEGE